MRLDGGGGEDRQRKHSWRLKSLHVNVCPRRPARLPLAPLAEAVSLSFASITEKSPRHSNHQRPNHIVYFLPPNSPTEVPKQCIRACKGPNGPCCGSRERRRERRSVLGLRARWWLAVRTTDLSMKVRQDL